MKEKKGVLSWSKELYIGSGLLVVCLVLYLIYLYTYNSKSNVVVSTMIMPITGVVTNYDDIIVLDNTTIELGNSLSCWDYKFDITMCSNALTNADYSNQTKWIWNYAFANVTADTQLFASPLHFRTIVDTSKLGTIFTLNSQSLFYVIIDGFAKVKVNGVTQINGTSIAMNDVSDSSVYDKCATIVGSTLRKPILYPITLQFGINTIDLYCINGDGINATLGSSVISPTGVAVWCVDSVTGELLFCTNANDWTVQPLTVATKGLIASIALGNDVVIPSKAIAIWNNDGNVIGQNTKNPLRFQYTYISNKDMPNAYFRYTIKNGLTSAQVNNKIVYLMNTVSGQTVEQLPRSTINSSYISGNYHTGGFLMPLVAGANKIVLGCINDPGLSLAGIAAWCTPNYSSPVILFATNTDWRVDRISNLNFN